MSARVGLRDYVLAISSTVEPHPSKLVGSKFGTLNAVLSKLQWPRTMRVQAASKDGAKVFLDAVSEQATRGISFGKIPRNVA